jgi:hypothetical protein
MAVPRRAGWYEPPRVVPRQRDENAAMVALDRGGFLKAKKQLELRCAEDTGRST